MGKRGVCAFGKSVKTNCRRGGHHRKAIGYFHGIRRHGQSCAGDYPSWCKNIDSAAKRSFIRLTCARAHATNALRYSLQQPREPPVFSQRPGASRLAARGYRFDSSHSSKSNKKLIESVTPPDFTNEISKYQFHVTLCAGLPSVLRLVVQVLDRLAENPKLERNELPKLYRTFARNSLIIIRG